MSAELDSEFCDGQFSVESGGSAALSFALHEHPVMRQFYFASPFLGPLRETVSMFPELLIHLSGGNMLAIHDTLSL